MKLLISVVCLLICMMEFGMNTSADEDILFPNGVYNPASALAAWKKFVEKEGKYISNDGRPLHQKLVDGQGLLEKALTEDKDANTIELLKLLNAVGTQMLPHIQDEKVRQIHSVVVDDVSKLINDAAANKLGKDDIHNFIRKTYKGVSAL